MCRPEDAQCAIAAGANLIGVIFAKSKRQVSSEQVKQGTPKTSKTQVDEECFGVFCFAEGDVEHEFCPCFFFTLCVR